MNDRHISGNREVIGFSPSQKVAMEALRRFMDSPDQRCFILKGYAGTGKTFLIRSLVRHLVGQNRCVRLMAPTGRAAMVLKQRADHPAYTIHKSIYSMDRLQEFEDSDSDFKYFFTLRDLADDETDMVVIVDEASMVSDTYAEGEYLRFGSGRLLADLIRYARVQSGQTRSKIIFVGDPAQLPPVNSKTSPALDAAYLATTYGLKAAGITLVDVVRQETGSLLLANATAIRSSIEAGRFNRFELAFGQDTLRATPADVVPYCFTPDGASLRTDTIVVTYRNATALAYNKMVRDRRYGGEGDQAPRAGDRFVVAQNNAALGLLNGDFVEVLKAEARTESRQWRDTVLTFRNVTIACTDPEGRRLERDCKIIDSLLLSPAPGLTRDEYKALYVDFKIRNPDLRPNTEPFRMALGSDPYFNALRVKYGYAITCHKAQGGEWPRVAAIFEACQGWTCEPAFRWIYTAVTRARTRLLAVDPPVFRPFPAPLPHVATAPGALVAGSGDRAVDAGKVPGTLPEREFPAPPDGREFLVQTYSMIKGAAPATGLSILSVDHLPWAERYCFQREGERATVDFYYDKKGIFTVSSVVNGSAPDVVARVAGILSPVEFEE